MSHLSALARPPRAAPHAAGAQPTLADLRGDIDAVDDALLELVEARMDLARRVGDRKAAGGPETALNWRPGREAELLGRLLARAGAASRPLTLAVWRELIGAGLAAQGPLEVTVWDGGDWGLREKASRRFGAAADYTAARSADQALARASTQNAVAVLALAPDAPWWTELGAAYPELWICEALDGPRGAGEPAALVVARVEPAALASGRTFVLSVGGDADLQARTARLLGYAPGARLYVIDEVAGAPVRAEDRHRGVLGRAPAFCLRPDEAIVPATGS
jgi:chorismate mutase